MPDTTGLFLLSVGIGLAAAPALLAPALVLVLTGCVLFLMTLAAPLLGLVSALVAPLLSACRAARQPVIEALRDA
jgi:hypothetical protein